MVAGRKVECVFDPFDLTVLEIFCNGSAYGTRGPPVIGRVSHPKAKPEEPGTPPPVDGIDYLCYHRPPSTRKPSAGTASATTPSTATAGTGTRGRAAQ